MMHGLQPDVRLGSIPVNPTRISRNRRAAQRLTPLFATSDTASSLKLKPDWAGKDDKLSRLLNKLISIEPLYNLMKFSARRVLIQTAEKNGIPWRGIATGYDNRDVYDHYRSITAHSILTPLGDAAYPSYYTRPFHAYDEGNLNWLAAREAEPATFSMALRVWPKESLTPEAAQQRLRQSFTNALLQYLNQSTTSNQQPSSGVMDVLDVGCSVGISTEWLCDAFPHAKVSGLDLSPHFLAVAAYRDAQRNTNTNTNNKPRVAAWLHRNFESSQLDPQSYDVITIQFVLHECPEQVTRNFFTEARRLLRPGGVVAMCDNNPKSLVIQNLPPALFTLMKSTEPWTDEYYTMNVEEAMRDAGFVHVETSETDPRHRTILGRVPFN